MSEAVDDFEIHVNNVMKRQSAGIHVSTTVGQKRNGTRFALVKTQVAWYAVRIILEGSYAVEREEFYTDSLAEAYIDFKKRQLESMES